MPAQRGIECVSQVTAEHLSAYRRSLFHYRNPRSGRPLKFATQAHYLIPVRCWFGWLLESTWTQDDVTAKLELPKEEQRLPTGVLSADQVELLLNLPSMSIRARGRRIGWFPSASGPTKRKD